MDLSFNRFDKDMAVTLLPSDLAVLMVGIAARQAASPTANVQARIVRGAIDPQLFAPLHGAFNGAVATALVRWREG